MNISRLKMLMTISLEYFQESTIHGLKYTLLEQEKHKNSNGILSNLVKLRFFRILGSILWSIVCICATGVCLFMMHLVWERFQTTPTVMTIEDFNYPIWKFSFPAVTICNQNKVQKSSTKNIADKLIKRGRTMEEVDIFLSSLSSLIKPERMSDLLISFDKDLEDLNYTTDSIMRELTQPCSKLLKTCLWLGEQVACNTTFRMMKSSEGYCCAFNYHALPDELELKDAGDESYHHEDIVHVAGAGRYSGLSVLLDIQMEEYTSSTRSFYGALAIIHDPEVYPEVSVTKIFLQANRDVSVTILPNLVESSERVRSLPVSQRQCWFEDEVMMRSAREYNYETCITQCRVDTIARICRCVPFYYPEIHLSSYTKQHRQCTLSDIPCLNRNRNTFASLLPSNLKRFKKNVTGMSCDCLPTCSDTFYNADANIADRTMALHSPLFDTDQLHNLTTLHVYFKDLISLKYRRDVFMTWDALFASFGGLFGLCLGGSVLSLVEIFYFFTLRLYARYLYLKTSEKKSINSKEFIANYPRSWMTDKRSKMILNSLITNQVKPHKNFQQYWK